MAKAPKEVKDLYTENYKTLPKEFRKTQIIGMTCHVHRPEDLIVLTLPYYPKRSTD